MRILLNGEPRAVESGTAVHAVVNALQAEGKGTAVAVNGEVVPRSSWPRHELADGDSVEVLTAVPGG